MRICLIILYLVLPWVVGSCSNHPNPIQSISSNEYEVYSRYIELFLADIQSNAKIQHFTATSRYSIGFDSTSVHTEDDTMWYGGKGVTVWKQVMPRILLGFCPDTIQLSSIWKDFLDKNKLPFRLDLDSIRYYLSNSSVIEADSLELSQAQHPYSREMTPAIVFKFNRVAFNPQCDQALLRVIYWHGMASYSGDVYFIKKGSIWQLVKNYVTVHAIY